MQDQQDDSGWDDLIKELGAEPDQEAFERKQSQTDIPSESVEAPEESSGPVPSASDWVDLANQLGIEPIGDDEDEPTLGSPERIEESFDFDEEAVDESQASDEFSDNDPSEGFEEASATETDPPAFSGFEEPDLSSVADADVEESSPDVESSASSEVDASEEAGGSDSPVGMAGDAARSAFDALFSRIPSRFRPGSEEDNDESADGQAEDTVGSETEEAESVSGFADGLEDSAGEPSASEGDEEEKPKRKRRRRRGRRGRSGRDSERSEEGADLDQEIRDAEEADIDDSEEASEGERESEEDGERRPRRRRSRRRRRSSTSSERNEAGELDDPELADPEEDALADEEPAEGESGAARRAGHRNIPSWSEAIGVIVDANVESRSKSPSRGSSSRGRGGRGGRRGRGGGGSRGRSS